MQSRWPKWQTVEIDEKSKAVSSARRELKENNGLSVFSITQNEMLSPEMAQLIMDTLTEGGQDNLTIDLSGMVIDGASMVGLTQALADDHCPSGVALILKQAKLTVVAFIALARFIYNGKFKPNLNIDLSIDDLYIIDNHTAIRVGYAFFVPDSATLQVLPEDHTHEKGYVPNAPLYIQWALTHQKEAPPWHLKLSTFVVVEIIDVHFFYQILSANRSLQTLELTHNLPKPLLMNPKEIEQRFHRNPYLTQLTIPEKAVFVEEDEKGEFATLNLISGNKDSNEPVVLTTGHFDEKLPPVIINIIESYFLADRTAFPMIDLSLKTFIDETKSIEERFVLFYENFKRYGDFFSIHPLFETFQTILQKNIAYVMTRIALRRDTENITINRLCNTDDQYFSIKNQDDKTFKKTAAEVITTLLQWAGCDAPFDDKRQSISLQQLKKTKIIYLKETGLKNEVLQALCQVISHPDCPEGLVVLIESMLAYQTTIDALAKIIKEGNYPKGLQLAILGIDYFDLETKPLYDALAWGFKDPDQKPKPELHLLVPSITKSHSIGSYNREARSIRLQRLLLFNKNLVSLVLTDEKLLIDHENKSHLKNFYNLNEQLTTLVIHPHRFTIDKKAFDQKNIAQNIALHFKKDISLDTTNKTGFIQFFSAIVRDQKTYLKLFDDGEFTKLFKAHQIAFFTWMVDYYLKKFWRFLDDPDESLLRTEVKAPTHVKHFCETMATIADASRMTESERDTLFEGPAFEANINSIFNKDTTKKQHFKHTLPVLHDRLPVYSPFMPLQSDAKKPAENAPSDETVPDTIDRSPNTKIEKILTDDKKYATGLRRWLCVSPREITTKKNQLLTDLKNGQGQYEQQILTWYLGNRISLRSAFKLLEMNDHAFDMTISTEEFKKQLNWYEDQGRGGIRRFFNTRTKTVDELTKLHEITTTDTKTEPKNERITKTQIEFCLAARDARGLSLFTRMARGGVIKKSLVFFQNGTVPDTLQEELRKDEKRLSATETLISMLSGKCKKSTSWP